MFLILWSAAKALNQKIRALNGEMMESILMGFERDNQHSEREQGLAPERRLWAAVLLLAVNEWRSKNMKFHRDAEVFLFESRVDFETACYGAGFDPSAFRSKLKRLRDVPPPVSHPSLAFAA